MITNIKDYRQDEEIDNKDRMKGRNYRSIIKMKKLTNKCDRKRN